MPNGGHQVGTFFAILIALTKLSHEVLIGSSAFRIGAPEIHLNARRYFRCEIKHQNSELDREKKSALNKHKGQVHGYFKPTVFWEAK